MTTVPTMPRLRRAAATVLVMLGSADVDRSAAQVAPVPRRDLRPAADRLAPTSGTIRGRVVIAGSGEPVRRAVIDVTAVSGGSRIRTLSDADGRYQVPDLPPGAYTIRFSRNGFVSIDYGQRHPFQLGRWTVTIGDGVENVGVALVRAAAISGALVDEDGEPLAGAVVAVARLRMVNGRRTLAVVSRSRPSNDLGEFRVGGLPEGEYVVGVAPRLEPRDDIEQEYSPTYYPGTNSVAEALRVRVRSGEELSWLVFPVTSSRAASVGGIVTSTEPTGPLTVTMRQQSITGTGTLSTRTGPERVFRFNDVPPGDYTVEASRSTTSGFEYAVTNVVVAGRDVNVTLNLRPPPMLRGRIRVDAAASSALPAASSVTVVSESSIGDRLLSSQAQPRGDWTFEVPAIPRALTTIRTRVPAGWTAARISINGKDIVAPIATDGDVSGLEITLTNRLSTITGVAVDAQGEAAAAATVLIMQDPRVQGARVPVLPVRTALVDSTGMFTLRDVLPGAYVAVILEYVEEGAENDREWLSRLVPLGIPLSVTTQQLRIGLRLTRNP